MKNYITIIVLSIICFTAKSQTKFEEYEKAYDKLDITKVSGNLLYMINEEMKSKDSIEYKKFIQTKRAEIYTRFNLGKKDTQQIFLDNYNDNLDRIKSTYLTNDVLMHMDRKIITTYGNNVLSRYQGNYSSEYVSAMLVPVIKSKMVEYTNEKIKQASDLILNEKVKLDSLSEQIVAYWKATGEKINVFKNDVNTIQQKIVLLANQIPGSDSLKTLIIISTNSLANNIQKKLQIGWSGELTISTQQVDIYKNKFIQSYQTYATDVHNKTQESFKELGSELNTLANNEKTVQETLSRIHNDWQNTQNTINDLEKNIQDPQKAVQHAQLVAENFIRLDIINKYVNKGTEIYSTVSYLKSEVYDKIADPAFINSLSLDNFSLPTLSDALGSAAGIASSIGKIFPNSAFPEVANVANKLMAAVNVGIGVAELYSGNPMGLINIFSGLSGIFGGKPEPSPEMQMMQHMMDYMENQFSNIDSNLHYIEQQLSNLTVTVQDMYKDMMKSFSLIGDKLDRISRQDSVLLNRTNLLLTGDWNQCPNVESEFKEENKPSYDDYKAIIQNSNDCKPCLTAVSRYTIKRNGDFNTEGNSTRFDLADLIVNGIFKPTADLFTLLNETNLQNALNSLGVMPNTINNNGNIYYNSVVQNKLAISFPKDSVFNYYYDYEMLAQQANYLNEFSTIFEITNADLATNDFYQFLNENPLNKQTRLKFLVPRFVDLLELINYSIIQQSLLSGNTMMGFTYGYLLGSCNCNTPKDNLIINTAITVLDSNKLFAKNFASMLVNNSINRSMENDAARAKRFTDLYFSTDVSKKDLLNAEFATPMVTYDIDDNNGLILRINGRGREFTIPVPPPPFIISNEMAQSDGLYILLAAKEKIINKLIDLTYFNTFKPANGLTKNDYKYLIQDLK